MCSKETVETDDKTTRYNTANVGERDWDKQKKDWEGDQEIKGQLKAEWHTHKYIPTLWFLFFFKKDKNAFYAKKRNKRESSTQKL